MGGDTGFPSPGDLVGGNIADEELSFLLCSCQPPCICLEFYTHRCATMGTYKEDIRRVDDMLPYPHAKLG